MYINFFPAQNFLKDFCTGGRPVWNVSPGKRTRDITDLLARHYHIAVHNGHSYEGDYSFILSSFSNAPERLKKRIPQELENYPENSFVCLLKNGKTPAVWIGGSHPGKFFSTLQFFSRAFPFLAEKHLLAADLHIHTTCSDGEAEPENIFPTAARTGLDAVAITDHNTLEGIGIARKNSPSSFPVIAGREIKDTDNNHLLVYGESTLLRDGSKPEVFIKCWRDNKFLVVQAHPSSRKYFLTDGKKAFGVEAFNYVSSAPFAGRRYAGRMFRQGYRIPVLGNSDAHLAEDIGQARTYLRVASLNDRAILKAVAGGDTAAFWRGTFAGSRTLCKSLQYLYRFSNILSGKLVPLVEKDMSRIRIQDSSTLQWRPLSPAAGHPERRLYCDGKNCDCRETWFRINRAGPFLMEFGRQKEAILNINGVPVSVLIHPGMDRDVSPFLRRGNNTIEVKDAEVVSTSGPGLCLGHEVRNWEIKIEGRKWRKIQAGSNLQMLGIVPVHYKGEMVYRTRIAPSSFQYGVPALFFDGTDGHIKIAVNGETVLHMNNTHWWDGYEVPLPPDVLSAGEIKVEVFLTNEAGFCGITNRVFAGGIIPLERPVTAIRLDGNKPDLQVIRCGERRVRGFLCDVKGNIIRSMLAGSPLHPFSVKEREKAAWAVLNSFADPLPFYRPRVACISERKKQ